MRPAFDLPTQCPRVFIPSWFLWLWDKCLVCRGHESVGLRTEKFQAPIHFPKDLETFPQHHWVTMRESVWFGVLTGFPYPETCSNLPPPCVLYLPLWFPMIVGPGYLSISALWSPVQSWECELLICESFPNHFLKLEFSEECLGYDKLQDKHETSFWSIQLIYFSWEKNRFMYLRMTIACIYKLE